MNSEREFRQSALLCINSAEARMLRVAYPGLLDDAIVVTSEGEMTGLRITRLFVGPSFTPKDGNGVGAVWRGVQSMDMCWSGDLSPIFLFNPLLFTGVED